MTGAVPSRIVYVDGAPRVEWLHTRGARFTEPFFEDTLLRLRCSDPANARGVRPVTPLDALRAIGPGAPLAAFIFHVSRCGSTLVAQMLAALPRHIVVAEPPILDNILRTADRHPCATDEDRLAWLRGAVRALGQPSAAGGDRLFVKLDSWHLFSLPLLRRAFPDTPFVFVYRHPVEVLVSGLARPGLTFLPGTISPVLLGLTAEAGAALSREEYAAAVVGAFFRAACVHRAELRPLAYADLPGAVLAAFPDCALSPDERTRILAAAAFNAKDPDQPFVPDAAAKRRVASPALLAATEQWALPTYARWLDLV